MSYSDEWTDWHLTPRGWEAGSDKTDGVGIAEKDEPPDRVLTYRSRETQTSPYSSMHKRKSKLWESDDKEAIKALLEKFGPPPG